MNGSNYHGESQARLPVNNLAEHLAKFRKEKRGSSSHCGTRKKTAGKPVRLVRMKSDSVLSTYLPIYLSIYLPTYLPTYLSIYLYLPTYLPTYILTYPSINLPDLPLPTYLPIYLFIYVFIYYRLHNDKNNQICHCMPASLIL